MTIQSWLMYLTFVIAVTASPGPAALFVVTNSILHGRRKAVYSALGNITGLFFLGLIAITGLGALVKASEVIYMMIKFTGAAYLIFLGLKLIINRDFKYTQIKKIKYSKNVTSCSIYFNAIVVAFSNPKAIIFLTALFPQFINHNRPIFSQFLLLITTFMACSFFFLLCYAMVARQGKKLFTKSWGFNLFDWIGGLLFIGWGLLLIRSSQK